MEKITPIEQLLLTEENLVETVLKIYVKKKDVPDPNIINNLKHLYKAAKYKSNPARMLALFEARLKILEGASEIYLEKDEDLLFDEAMSELDVIEQILQFHKITR